MGEEWLPLMMVFMFLPVWMLMLYDDDEQQELICVPINGTDKIICQPPQEEEKQQINKTRSIDRENYRGLTDRR